MSTLKDSSGGPDFQSPTLGSVSFDELFVHLADYVEENPTSKYNLIIGTDSFQDSETVFVSAVVVHRVGHGGRYFYSRHRRKKIGSMRHRIIYEATASLELASRMGERLKENGLKKLPLEIHLDIGEGGDTRDIIKEVVGMVTGCGYTAVTKPDSYGASKVADRHSK